MGDEQPVKNVFDEGIVYKIEMGSIGVKRQARTGAVDVKAKEDGQDPDKDAVDINVKLFKNCKELQAITDLQGDVRKFISVRAIPSVLERGAFLVHKDHFLEVREYVKQKQAALPALVDALVAVYPKLKEQAKARLKALWNPAHFPDETTLREKFYIRARVIEVGVPGRIKELYGQAVLDEELATLKEEYSNATQEIMQGLRVQFAGMLKRMQEIVKGDGNGKAAYFKNSAIFNFKEFLEFFDPKNIAGDSELKDLVDKCHLVMQGIDPDDIRGSKAVISELQNVFNDVAKILPSLVAEKPSRRVLG